MNIDKGKESFSPEEIEDLRKQLLAHREERSLSWPALAERVGEVGSSTLNAWALGTYSGRNEVIAWKVQRYFLAEEHRRDLQLSRPIVPGYVQTRTSRMMMAQLRWAHEGEMVAIVGNPGMGKTATFDQYVGATPNAFKATMQPATRSVQPMLLEICRAVGAATRSSTATILTAALRIKLENVRAVLIIDEAQHLRDAALDQLRSLHDLLGIGIVLAGNAKVLNRVQLGAHSADFAQLASRVSWPQTYLKPDREDVETLCAAWGVEHAREREFLHKVAQQPGALRGMSQVLKMATLQALSGHEDRTLSHMTQAWQATRQQPLSVVAP
jgi:DNA transposition AAA+ family ATPase